MSNGKIIVIDGLDGSGKSTQLEITEKKLNEMGYNVRTISFPDYDSQSSALVKMYLNGEFSSNPNDINAYAASSFYAVDRYASYMKNWKKDYENNTIILAARYVSSNALHQMSKLNQEKWSSYLDWLYDYEHDKLGIPRADLTIFLDMSIEASQKLLSKRYKGDDTKKDIHEADLNYLQNCRDAASYAASKCNWNVIKCNDDSNNIFSVDEITEKILNVIKSIL